MTFRKNSGALALWAALLTPAQFLTSPAGATEGYFQHGYGMVSQFMGGAGAAYSQDAMSQATNPAGLVGLDNQVNLGLSFFSPQRGFTGKDGTNPGRLVPNTRVDSKAKLFLIPNAAANYKIDAKSAIGVAFYGNGGMNTTYSAADATCSAGAPGVFCDGKTGVDLNQAFLQFTYAREIFKGVSLGVAPIVAMQLFEAKGLTSFSGFSSDPANLTNEGTDVSFGIGGRFGVQAKLPANIQLGAAYQMRTYMTKFDKYAGLFAEQGSFDIPPALQAGISWKPVEAVTLLFDYRRIWYSQVDAVGNKFFFPSPGKQLGDDDGPGFGWNDANIFKVGAQWDIDKEWTVRAGYSYTDQPIDGSEVLFNILAPGVMEHHITAGVTYSMSEDIKLHLGGFYAPKSTVSGANPFDPAQTITLHMYQFQVAAGVAFRF